MEHIVTSDREILEIVNMDEWILAYPKVFYRKMTNEEVKMYLEGRGTVKKKHPDGYTQTFFKKKVMG